MFEPDVRNRKRQRYCRKEPCRKARKADSQRRWLSKPGNTDYFSGEDNMQRVRAWRERHPGYSRRRRRATSVALQDRSPAQESEAKPEAPPDDPVALQDRLIAQSPLLVGLISHLVGSALQDDIAAMTRRLHSRGRAVMGMDVPGPAYAKTNHPERPGAAGAAFV